MMNRATYIYAIFLSVMVSAIVPFEGGAQTNGDEQLVQFSGVVLDADSLTPIPYATVLIKNTRRGTTTDFYGFFSFVAEPGDTVRFSNVGYRIEYYVLPDTLTGKRYSMIQLLRKDTVQLDELTVYPWPDKEQFKEAFLSLRLPDDDLKRARRNLSRGMMAAKMRSVPMTDGAANFQYSLYNRNNQIYEAGQYPSFTILNPLAWAQFIQAWKDGEFTK